MIYDTLDHIARYKGDGALYKALTWAREYRGVAAQDDVELDGRDLYAMVRTLTSSPRDGRNFESHRKYIDVHVVLSGEEGIDFSVDRLAVATAYDAAKDCELQKPAEEFGTFQLRPGAFAVFFPGEVHRPSCAISKAGTSRKIVLKIART